VAITYNCLELTRGFFTCLVSYADKRRATDDAAAPTFWRGLMKSHLALALVTCCVALAPATVRSQSQESQSQYTETQEDKGACMADALAVCGQFIPDRERVASCLIANSSMVSPTCREAIKRFVPRTAAVH
jgi:hypothetical protein